MDEVLIERIFSEIDTLAQSLTKLSEVVHKDNALLQIIHKIVFCIVLSMISGAIAFGWYQFQKDNSTPSEKIKNKEGEIVIKKIINGG